MRHCMDGDYAYIGHFHDHFTKFNVLFPLKTTSEDEVSAMLEERVLAYFGPPKVFHSDQGREFVHRLIQATYERWGGDIAFINGRPQHGPAERHNGLIEQKLEALKQEEGFEEYSYPWSSWLPKIMWTLNSQGHEATTDSPYHLVFHRQPPVGVFPSSQQHCVDEEDLCEQVPVADPLEQTSPTRVRESTCPQSPGSDLPSSIHENSDQVPTNHSVIFVLNFQWKYSTEDS